jgi:hypothetical protein
VRKLEQSDISERFLPEARLSKATTPRKTAVITEEKEMPLQTTATKENCETEKIPERKNNRTSRLYKPSLKTYVP